MTPLIGISKQGEDVLTITNPNDFIFNSDYNTFKILSTGLILSQSVPTSGTVVSVAHGQSGIPSVYAFAKFPTGEVALPGESNKGTNVIGSFENIEIDNTNIYFIFSSFVGTAYSVGLRYYIFEAPI